MARPRRLGERFTPEDRHQLRFVRRMRAGTRIVVLAGRTHGLRGTYNDGCKCDACTDAEADHSLVQKRKTRALAAAAGSVAS